MAYVNHSERPARDEKQYDDDQIPAEVLAGIKQAISEIENGDTASKRAIEDVLNV